MTKLSGPLFSLTAHGSIADALTYSRKKGVNVGRFQRKQKDYVNLARQINRGKYRDLVFGWNSLSADDKLLWKQDCKSPQVSGYHNYIKKGFESFNSSSYIKKNPAGDMSFGTGRFFEHKVHAGGGYPIKLSGDYGYYTTTDNPSRLVKFLKADPRKYWVYPCTANENYFTDMLIYNGQIITTVYGSPGGIVTWELANPTNQVFYDFGGTYPHFMGIYYSGTFIYTTVVGNPAKLLRIQPHDFNSFSEYNYQPWVTTPIGCQPGYWYYFACNYGATNGISGTSPILSDYKLSLYPEGGHGWWYGLLYIGGILYAVSMGTPDQIAKVIPFPPYGDSVLTFPSDFGGAKSLCTHGDYIYVIHGTKPPRFSKVRISDFSIVSNITLPDNDTIPAVGVTDGTFVYTTSLSYPTGIWKIYL